ncbi:hypothetical protein AVEN_125397-1 [Araneus ventricosus]|uniref:Uncharacterized protein n=1 Tax=Araneus ventricosus TaxID=182803 RepID=A0A4Y2TPV1_ARAVE|nr:hypothetical protein AVEN_125397-1 [Araneus ventricosus]
MALVPGKQNKLKLSSIDYGCMVYGSARPTVLRRLDTIHHSALRICSGTFRTSPVESLYVVCHQLPLQLRRQKISALYFFRAQSVPRHPISQLTIPLSLRRLYAARPSITFCPFVRELKFFCMTRTLILLPSSLLISSASRLGISHIFLI